MFGISPQWLVVPAAVSVVLAAVAVSPEPGAGSDAVTYSDPEADVVRLELQARLESVSARIAYKDELISNLIAGQATLAEVSAEFLRINQGTKSQKLVQERYPGSNDEEKSARNVIEFVRARRLPAAQNAAVMNRLRQEFERAYGQPCEAAG